MTKLLEKAVEEAQALPEAEQDLIAAVILGEIDADRAWDELLDDPRTDHFLRQMGQDIRRQKEAGEITSGDDFLDEIE